MNPGSRLGPYELVRQIGQGGMGAVWLARDPVLDREIALKVLLYADLDGLSRFATEAKALARVASPHVVQVFAYHADTAPPCIAMELVDGESLSARIARIGPAAPAQLVDAAWQTLGGLAVAHARGVVHRDIKPGNVLVTRDGTYKLADFGLAQVAGGDQTASGEVLGTLRYVAPELLAGGLAGVRSDLYALGLVLRQMAIGMPPWSGEQSVDLIRRITSERLPPVAVALPDLPAGLAGWLDRMCARESGDRFADAATARAALDAVAAQCLPAAPARPTVPAPSFDEPTRLIESSSDASAAAVQSDGTQRPIVPPPPPVMAPVVGGRSFALHLLLPLWGIASLVALGLGMAIWSYAYQREFSALQGELRAAASGCALLLDGEDVTGLDGPAARSSAVFARIDQRLQAFMATNPVLTAVYLVRQGERPGLVRFVVDSTPEVDRNHDGRIGPDEAQAQPGDPYEAASLAPAMIEAFTSGYAADRQPSTDQWGTTLSGYARVRSGAGPPVVVGVDVSAITLDELTHAYWWRVTAMIAVALIIALAAAWLTARRLNRPLADLAEALSAIARGDLSVRPRHHGACEFRQLAAAVDLVADGLAERAAVRAAFERYLTNAVAARVLHREDASVGSGPARRIAVLACDFHVPATARSDPNAASDLGAVVAAVFAAVVAHGGTAERALGDGLVAVFSGDGGEERAARAAIDALRRLGRGGPARVRLGVTAASVADDTAFRRTLAEAVSTARLARRIDVDLLADATAYSPLRHMFIADTFALPDGRRVHAIKGAVS